MKSLCELITYELVVLPKKWWKAGFEELGLENRFVFIGKLLVDSYRIYIQNAQLILSEDQR